VENYDYDSVNCYTTASIHNIQRPDRDGYNKKGRDLVKYRPRSGAAGVNQVFSTS